jgi:hypothetical protein
MDQALILVLPLAILGFGILLVLFANYLQENYPATMPGGKLRQVALLLVLFGGGGLLLSIVLLFRL